MNRSAILARRAGRACALVWLASVLAAAAQDDLPEPSPTAPLLRYEVVREYPHDRQAYTEGLVYRDGRLYESTGLVGRSALQVTDLASGKRLQRIEVPPPYFAEGLARAGSRWVQLTWKSGQGFVYDTHLNRVGQFSYHGEGWGLTYDGRALIMSNGSPLLQRLDPRSFAVVGTLVAHDQDTAVGGLNELEFANNRIYANIWLTDRIAVIDAVSGQLSGWLDLSALRERFRLPPDWNARENVLNGIAYDPKNGHLLVTGKCWPKLFEIAIRQ